MGGWGSNRWGSHQRKTGTDECYKVSITDLTGSCLAPLPDGYERLTGSINIGNTSKIGFLCKKDNSAPGGLLFSLYYLVSGGGQPEEIITTKVMLDRTEQPRRYWFLCPDCNKRVGVLFMPYNARRFKCRHCHKLQYASAQNKRKPTRRYGGAMHRLDWCIAQEKKYKGWEQSRKRRFNRKVLAKVYALKLEKGAS